MGEVSGRGGPLEACQLELYLYVQGMHCIVCNMCSKGVVLCILHPCTCKLLVVCTHVVMFVVVVDVDAPVYAQQ